jgi:hypothetical protein
MILSINLLLLGLRCLSEISISNYIQEIEIWDNV